jgi:hypothetical protein
MLGPMAFNVWPATIKPAPVHCKISFVLFMCVLYHNFYQMSTEKCRILAKKNPL